MTKIAIFYSTKDRTELTRRTVEPLLADARAGKYDLFWLDGSDTEEGKSLARDLGYPTANVIHDVRGGADAAIVYALRHGLNHEANYDYIGLVENDVLLDPNWFGPTFALFKRGAAEGLAVGAVSARCYQDRILCQRDGYALMHNLGAGMVLFTREGAGRILNGFRTSWTMENRRTFMNLSGIDIGRYWAFGGGEHWLTADWGFDRVLAEYGVASLALTPSPVEMIGQVPSLAEQGLTLADKPFELLRDDKAFEKFKGCTEALREGGELRPNTHGRFQADDGAWVIFSHQLWQPNFEGQWQLKWAQGFGPFSYAARQSDAVLELPVSGPCAFLVSPGPTGGVATVTDCASGYTASPELSPAQQAPMQIAVPGGVTRRLVTLQLKAPGLTFNALVAREPQPWRPDYLFEGELPAP